MFYFHAKCTTSTISEQFRGALIGQQPADRGTKLRPSLESDVPASLAKMRLLQKP
jgi:hypothetical protein